MGKKVKSGKTAYVKRVIIMVSDYLFGTLGQRVSAFPKTKSRERLKL
jgi:hypothetical protein